MAKKLNKQDVKDLIKKLFIKNSIEENHIWFYKSMAKKELKEFINTNWWFTKWKVDLSFVSKQQWDIEIPKDAFWYNAILSDESINMNWYRILSSAWSEWFLKYYNDYEWSVYLQHDMEQPIGKTLSIWVDESTKELIATWYAYDDLTQNRISRGLVTDISTGHIPLEIKYINKDTNQELTPAEFEEMLWDMIDHMWVDDATWEDMKKAIAEMRDLRVETHTKVQIVEYSFVSVWSNTQARVRKINNAVETIDEEINDEVELVKDEEEEVIEENNEEIDWEHEEENQEENNENINEHINAENNLEEEGGTPEGKEDITPENPETVDDQEENLVEKNKVLQTQVDELTNKVVILEWEKTALKDEVETLKSDLTLIKGHQSGKIVVLDVDNEDNLKKVDQKVLQKEVTNYKNILNNGY